MTIVWRTESRASSDAAECFTLAATAQLGPSFKTNTKQEKNRPTTPLSLSLSSNRFLSLFHSFINLYDIRAQFISLQFSTPPSLSLSFFLNFTHKHLFTFVLLVLGCKRLYSLPLFLFLRSHLQAFLIWFFSLLANPPFTLSRFHNPLAHEQCDQMVRFFFQYLAICYNANLPNSISIWQSRFKNGQILVSAFKNCPKTCRILPKWRNFG